MLGRARALYGDRAGADAAFEQTRAWVRAGASDLLGLAVASLGEQARTAREAGDTATAVNFPEVSIPFKENSHRLLHIHRNVPGVLSQINRLFAEAGINILAQSLMTEGDVGYLVMDVDYNDSTAALDQLKDVEETIRVRILF